MIAAHSTANEPAGGRGIHEGQRAASWPSNACKLEATAHSRPTPERSSSWSNAGWCLKRAPNEPHPPGRGTHSRRPTPEGGPAAAQLQGAGAKLVL
eukprot:6094181-Prymnesium_polylepis.1